MFLAIQILLFVLVLLFTLATIGGNDNEREKFMIPLVVSILALVLTVFL